MISQDTIAKIVDSADVIDVLGDFITLKRAGSNYKANCPFHNEKTPSFVVSPAKGIYKCFGCGQAGNSVKFVMEHEQMSYVEALKYLAQKYNIEIEEIVLNDEQRAEQTLKDSLFIVNEFARDTFVKNLHEHPEGKSIGLSYFRERGFSDEIIERFQLGYTLEQKDGLVALALEKGYKLEMLQKAGLASKREGLKLDFYRGRVMFPIHSVSGKVLGFGGRTLKKDKKSPKYINTPDTDIYDKSKILYGIHFARNTIRKLDESLMVEGYTDVISLFQAGIENVVASSGTSLTADQVKLVKRYSENITMLYDGDNAGIKAAMRGVDIILENGLNVKVVILPEGEDPDSFVRQKGADGFTTFIEENKQDFILFKSEILLKDSAKDPVKRAEAIRDIVESIVKIPDAIKRNIYIKECAQLFGIGEQVLATEVNKNRTKNRRDDEKKAARESESLEQAPADFMLQEEEHIETGIELEKYERNIIRLLVEFGKIPFDDEVLTAEYILQQLSDVAFYNPVHDKIVEIAQNRHEHKNYYEDTFFTNFQDEEIAQHVIELLAFPYSLSENWQLKKKVHTPNPEEKYKDNVSVTLLYLKYYNLKRLEIDLMAMLKEADAEQMEKYLKMKMVLDQKRIPIAKELGLAITIW